MSTYTDNQTTEISNRGAAVRRNQEPTMVIRLGDVAEIEIYEVHTRHAYQAHGIAWEGRKGGHTIVLEEKTAGGNYCKKSEALKHLFSRLGKKPKGWRGDCANLECYFKGGNFYRVPKSQVRKAK